MLKKYKNKKMPLGYFQLFKINTVAINLHAVLCLNLCEFLLISPKPYLCSLLDMVACLFCVSLRLPSVKSMSPLTAVFLLFQFI